VPINFRSSLSAAAPVVPVPQNASTVHHGQLPTPGAWAADGLETGDDNAYAITIHKSQGSESPAVVRSGGKCASFYELTLLAWLGPPVFHSLNPESQAAPLKFANCVPHGSAPDLS
jgi:hypothetical protein